MHEFHHILLSSCYDCEERYPNSQTHHGLGRAGYSPSHRSRSGSHAQCGPALEGYQYIGCTACTKSLMKLTYTQCHRQHDSTRRTLPTSLDTPPQEATITTTLSLQTAANSPLPELCPSAPHIVSPTRHTTQARYIITYHDGQGIRLTASQVRT